MTLVLLMFMFENQVVFKYLSLIRHLKASCSISSRGKGVEKIKELKIKIIRSYDKGNHYNLMAEKLEYKVEKAKT